MPSRIVSLARLVRLPAIFTAPPDVLIGYWLVGREFTGPSTLVLIVLASCALYACGMAWNDWFDIDIDRQQRPNRPIPSGAIAPNSAFILANSLMLGGIGLAFLASTASGVVAGILALLILTYSGPLKKTPAAPIVMGLCRSTNVLLGASLGWAKIVPPIDFPGILGGHADAWSPMLENAGFLRIAIANGVYIAGVTWFARQEAVQSQRLPLILGFIVMQLGILLHPIAWWVAGEFNLMAASMLACLWLLLFGMGTSAIRNPNPTTVQRAVLWGVRGIVFLNAASAIALVAPAGGMLIVLFLAPAMLLGRWLYST